MPSPPPGHTTPLVAISVLLQRLHDEIPPDRFTLGWLMHSLHTRSFGIITLLLALVAIAPGLSIVAGLLLMIPAFQMIIGSAAPVFPRRIATHPLPAKYLATVLQRSVPVLRYLEHVVHPRWHTPIEVTKRAVGLAVFMLSVTLVFFPLPLSNVVPALVIALLSLAYIEEDGVLLMIALLIATVTLSAAAAAVWGMAIGTQCSVVAMAKPGCRVPAISVGRASGGLVWSPPVTAIPTIHS